MQRIAGVPGVAVLAVFVGALLAAASSVSAAPRTLLGSPTPIRAFAQDGAYIAWSADMANPPPFVRRCGQMHIRSLVTGEARVFGIGPATDANCAGSVALGNRRALWIGSTRLVLRHV